jgi:hypothetical protein
VRISSVYGGGGAGVGSPATYNVDYVELFNNSGAAVNIGGWSIEYGSATGNWGSSPTNIFTFSSGTTIAACSYYLVAFGPPSAGGGTLPTVPDTTANGSLAMSATSGKVALFSSPQTNLACSGNVSGAPYVDAVGYGPTASCYETSPAGVLTNQQAVVRNGGGTVDTDANASDFTVALSPVPHNSHSGINANCAATPANSTTWGYMKSLYR